MKKFSILMTLVFLLTSNHFVLANTIVEEEAEIDCAKQSQELNMDEKLRLLTETALKYDIPPEVLKAIALAESQMCQFKDGEPLETNDGGIGIMQVTNTDIKVDPDRLKYDTAYNIDIGAQILKSKWKLQFGERIPMINDGNPRILENWYFAVMAYNGLSFVNDPNKNQEPYQETVYQELEKYSKIDVAEFPAINIQYKNGTMNFPDMKVNWEEATTESTQMFKSGDSVYVMNSESDPHTYDYGNLRTELSKTTSKPTELAYYTELEIVGGPYIGSSSKFNHFVFYEVKGSNFKGYIASSNLRRKSTDVAFKSWDEKTSSDIQKNWTIKLNQPINEETVNPRNVYIVDESGNGVRIDLTYHEDNHTIVVEPETPFVAGKKYSLMIKDVETLTNKSLKENILMPFSITP